jgi:hypothetical protein
LIQTQLSQDVAFDPGNVFFTGVSGGSLLLSGFFVPAFGATYKTGVVLNCGGLTPQVDVVDGATLAANMKIHFQYVKLCPYFHRFLGTELFGSLLREFGSSMI